MVTHDSDEAVARERIERMVMRERYVNDGSPTGLTWLHSSSVATCPRRGPRQFALPMLRMSADDVQMRGTVPAMFAGDHYKFPVHPDCIETLGRRLHERFISDDSVEYELVIPTASPRTVLLARRTGWLGFIKLDYPHVLGRFTRELSDEKLVHSLMVSEHLRAGNAAANGVCHFPEIGSLEIHAEGNHRSGVLFRDARPTGATEGEMLCICSLFGRDYFANDATEPLIVTLARQFGGLPWIAENIIDILLESFWTLVTQYALWPEAHAQNIVVGVGSNGATRIYWRDCQGMWWDEGLDATRVNGYHTIQRDAPDAAARRSFLYDWMLGKYVLEPLLAACAAVQPDAANALALHIREATRRLAANVLSGGLLPKETAYQLSLRAPEGERLALEECGNVLYR